MAAGFNNVASILNMRCGTIAEAWRRGLSSISFIPLSANQLNQRLFELTQRSIALLTAESFDPSGGQTIGQAVGQLHCLQPESLRVTQAVLGQQILEGLAAEHVALLSPRLVTFLSELAAGFFEYARQTLLDEQEQIRQALVVACRRAEDQVKELNLALVRRVTERTEQLETAIQDLEKEIAARKMILQTLQDTTQTLQAMIQSSPVAIIVTDLNSMVKLWNPAAERIFGWTASEAIGQLLPYVPPDKHGEHLFMRETARQAGFAGKEVRRRRKDGSLIDVNVSQAALYDTRGELTGYVLLIADITERTRAEAELRESEKRFRALIENSTDAISLIDANGNILYESPSYEWVMGHREEDRARQNMFELVHPDEREHLQRLLAGILEKPGQVVVPSTRVRRADGSWRWIEGIANNLLAEPSVRAIVINFRDITERKQAEEALRQYTSELQARNEELDAFAHMAAHDLKNPLANIIAYADEMRLDYDLLSEQERIMCVKAITTSGKKMNSILEELILLAGLRRVEVQLQPLDVASVVAEACQRLSFVIGKSQAEIVLPSAWPQAIGYAPWVEEIWANYISNAIQYGGKPPRVELGGEYLQDGTARFWTRDNGDGLTPEQQARLFTPFTQLNQVRAKGHGLGLSIVRRIVDKLHGQVGVESSGIPGQGCLFYFILPAPQS